jgi:hypothetical protein
MEVRRYIGGVLAMDLDHILKDGIQIKISPPDLYFVSLHKWISRDIISGQCRKLATDSHRPLSFGISEPKIRQPQIRLRKRFFDSQQDSSGDVSDVFFKPMDDWELPRRRETFDVTT